MKMSDLYILHQEHNSSHTVRSTNLELKAVFKVKLEITFELKSLVFAQNCTYLCTW